MTWLDLIRFAVFMGVLTILVKPVGGYLARVFRRERTGLDPKQEVPMSIGAAISMTSPDAGRIIATASPRAQDN